MNLIAGGKATGEHSKDLFLTLKGRTEIIRPFQGRCVSGFLNPWAVPTAIEFHRCAVNRLEATYPN
jgi:hypothetical protein